MSKRDEILKEILSDADLMKKYNITQVELENIEPFRPDSKKIVNILATIINENDNDRTGRQIYSTIKNIHKI
ncbi:hypothetical protein [Flavobacterium sp. LHD-85]|uniref:hypothetical protein n=1 Tax=Flavobacterium sp. LHD-85 TaxID=3071410 RepID=UPI0027E1AD52|nr:hypothetical protein [Flavobacterium sp. LHD-85]MDQ6532118.1 hypothetical protein [Flavobacterium sp. LHD-85]